MISVEAGGRGVHANLKVWGTNLIFWKSFPENCMKMKRNWTENGPYVARNA